MNIAKLGTMLLAVCLVLAIVYSFTRKNQPRVDQATLKSWLSSSQVIIMDVRAPKDWRVSARKIKGAVRQEPDEVKTWAANLPRDKDIVLY